jgi:uncharacterized protein YecE (DUF72 family)
MATDPRVNLETFHFRGIHPRVFIGTASDRYAGWLGQIYSPERYAGRVANRPRIVAGTTFVEEVLPVDSVAEYFQHFPVLEIDFTFYRALLEEDGKTTQNYQLLENYRRYLNESDRIFLKVPRIITAKKLQKGAQYLRNEAYLNSKIFTELFYEPAVKLLGANLTGFIFEQEYQRKADRTSVKEMARELDKFFRAIPRDHRYHLELRTELYLRDQVFQVLEKHGVGQTLSHWTWLPPLLKQLAKASGRFFNGEKHCLIRLLTPLGMRYEDSYARAYPFDRLVEGMLQPEIVPETVEIIKRVLDQGRTAYVFVNNRAGGNAPLLAQMIVEKFLEKVEPESPPQMSLW